VEKEERRGMVIVEFMLLRDILEYSFKML